MPHYIWILIVSVIVLLVAFMLFLRSEIHRIHRMIEALANIKTAAINNKIKHLAKFIKEVAFNHIEAELTNNVLKYLKLDSSSRAAQVFKEFILVSDVSSTAKTYLQFRGEATYANAREGLMKAIQRARNIDYPIFFLGSSPTVLQNNFTYTSKKGTVLILKTFEDTFIEALQASNVEAEQDLLKALSIYGSDPLDIAVYRSVFVDVYKDKLITWSRLFAATKIKIDADYADISFIPELLRHSKVTEALERLAKVATTDSRLNKNTIVIMQATHRELQENSARGLPDREGELKLMNNILNYASQITN